MKLIVDTMDAVATEVAIPSDLAGRDFWRRHFHEKDHVARDEFLDALMTFVGFHQDVNDPHSAGQVAANQQLSRLRTLLEDIRHDKNSDEVQIEHFGQLLNWFGPLDANMLWRISTVTSQAWFHGLIETKDAIARLQNMQELSFLVRLSTSSPGWFTISYLHPDHTVKHKRLQYAFNPDGSQPVFLLGPDRFNTLMEAIVATGLQIPAPGSKYQVLSQSNDASGYEQGYE